jgi:hypothetical protein
MEDEAMFRFTIREMILLTLIVALAVGNWLQWRESQTLRDDNHRLRISHEMMRVAIEMMEEREVALQSGEPVFRPVYAD